MTLISSFIKESEHTAEHLASARAFFDTKEKFCRTANFAIVHSSGVDCYHGASCHFNIQHPGGVPYLVATEIGATRRNPNSLSLAEASPLLDWFINRSPWAPLVVNKEDGLEQIYHTGLIFHTNTPLPFLQAALITTRMFYEQHCSMFHYFNKLVESGTNEAVAFGLIGSNTYVDCEKEETTYAIPAIGHRPLNPLTAEGLANLACGVVGAACPWSKKPRTYFKGGRSYNGGVKTFHAVNWVCSTKPVANVPCIYFPFEDDELKLALKAARNDTRPDVYTPPNPFKRQTMGEKWHKETRATLREFWDVVVPIIIKRTEALIAATVEEKEAA